LAKDHHHQSSHRRVVRLYNLTISALTLQSISVTLDVHDIAGRNTAIQGNRKLQRRQHEGPHQRYHLVVVTEASGLDQR
jgi:hypothetical protein